jgi:hypothetical protein
MKTPPATPQSARQMLDTYFLETRCKLIEIAANLDRVDRAPNLAEIRGDPRLIFIAEALKILESAQPNRAELIERLYSKE